MKLVNKLQAITGGLAVAAAVAGTYVAWGDGASRRTSIVRPAVVPGIANKPIEDLVSGRFGAQPILTYETKAKESLFAWQVKPTLDALPARPRDFVILVDTSASQAGRPLQMAARLAEQLVRDASPVDRVAVWTVNTPKATKNLSNGLQNPRSVTLETTFENLRKEYASGAVDLAGAVRKAARDFEGKKSRQQVIVYLGDGESAYEDLSEKDRYALSDELVASNVAFFAIPVGLKIHSANIHGLATGTGGAVVRITTEEAKPTASLAEFTARFNKSVNTPVLTDVKMQLPDVIAEVYPTKLPPMRADAPTLLVGKLKDQKPAQLKAKLTGNFAGKEVAFDVSDAIPTSQPDHFFLNSLISQWRESPFKDAPALLRADRVLALAYEQNRLAREELLSQAEFAMGSGQYETAENLYQVALKLDPSELEAKSGMKVIDRLKKGEITREQLKEIGAVRDSEGDRKKALQQVANQEPVPAPKASVPTTGAADDLLRQEEARRAVVEQQTRLLVEETLTRARRLLREGDPDAATSAVKQQRDALKELADIRADLRDRLLTQMELLLREIETTGQRLKAQRDEANERIARARQKLLDGDEKKQKEDRLRERISAFTRLMNQARHEDAYREALVLIQESINNGEQPPIEATAVYQIGQSATNLREARELVRLREDRFLMTMLQVEKAHVPYPDEPAVHFPPAKVWRELTTLRRKYAASDLEADMPAAVKERFRYLRKSLDNSLPLDKPISTTFLEVVKALEEIADPTDGKDPAKRIKIIINGDSFRTAKADPNYKIEEENVTLPAFNGMSLATALRLLTSPYSGTFLVRRDFIEIVHQDVVLEDKVIRVFPVADLVIPIPNSINQNSLNQQLSILGQTFSLGGQNPLTAANIFNQNAFNGGGNVNIGQGGMAPGGGGQMAGLGGLFQGQNVNLGVQGGVQGFGGGALGQFGNLGGQFGFQGGDQSTILITLIQQVIAPGEWGATQAIIGGQGLQNQGMDALDPTALDNSQPALPQSQLNQVGYYPPSLGLVVRGSSRFHKSSDTKLKKSQMGINLAPGRPFVKADAPAGNAQANARPAAVPANGKEPVAVAANDKAKPKEINAKKIWEEIVAKKVTDPTLVIASIDLLAQANEFGHVAELLKATLRKGLVTEPWAQEALALALEGTQSSPEELERARVSAVDLEPESYLAYLEVSKSIAKLGDQDRAIRFCQTAARLQPETADPYINALVFAGDKKTTDSDATLWAANQLLARDWPIDSQEFHGLARKSLTETAAKLTKENRLAEANKLMGLLKADQSRDLVIKMSWTGLADLDLKVTEPIGSVCTIKQRQTLNGGTMQADQYDRKEEARSETYTASQAFTGKYTIEVDRIWGRPVGNKVNVQVIKNQGSADQSIELFTLNLDQANGKLTIDLKEGRRTKQAVLPPSIMAVDSLRKPEREKQAYQRMEAMTAPVNAAGLQGGIASTGGNLSAQASADSNRSLTNLSYSVKQESVIENGMEMQTSVTYSSNGEAKMETKLVPQTAKVVEPRVRLSLIPGSDR